MNMETKGSGAHDERSEGYERRDADVAGLLKFALTLLAVLVAVLISMRWMFFHLAKSQQLGPPASPFENARVLPPQPRLQVQPHLDLQAYCEDQLRDLNSYGWVDPHNEVVRIPVNRAIDEILKRGLPARPAGSANPPGTAAVDAMPTASVPEANDLQGPCGYLVKPPAAKEEK